MLMLNYTHTLLALLPLFAIASPMTIAKRASDVLIVSNKDGKCLAVGTGPIQNGTPVLGVECQVAPGWDINYGSGSIVLSGTEYAVDIGLNPQDHGQLHLWQSYPTAAQQTWFLTDDKRIAQTGGTQCLDQGEFGLQTYSCSPGNENQVWSLRNKEVSQPPPVSLPGPVPSSSASVTFGDPPIHTYSVTFADPPAAPLLEGAIPDHRDNGQGSEAAGMKCRDRG